MVNARARALGDMAPVAGDALTLQGLEIYAKSQLGA